MRKTMTSYAVFYENVSPPKGESKYLAFDSNELLVLCVKGKLITKELEFGSKGDCGGILPKEEN